MLATVYKGVGLPPKMERVPLPKIQKPTNAIIRVHEVSHAFHEDLIKAHFLLVASCKGFVKKVFSRPALGVR